MLEVKGLLAGVAGKPISRLDRLSVRDGAAVLLAGPSGAGKTTLLLALAGLADILSGHIRIGDTDVSELGARARDRHRGRRIGIVFQDLHLVSGLSALDNMLLAPFAAGARRDSASALAMLDRLGLDHRTHAAAETLSRGEAQRVAIARALLMQPQLILADEPTASLDDEAASAVLNILLSAVRDSGAALVVATHDARVRARIADVVMARPA